MSATVTHVHAGLAAEMERALELHIGAEPWPPVDDAKYIACGIYADDLKLAAFIVAHPEAGGHLIPDSVLVDITEIEAFAVARRYGVDPNGRHYDTEHLETDTTSPLVGLPLSQAIWLATRVSERPLPPVPLMYRSWRHALVFERISEIGDIQIRQWQACWEGDVQVRKLPCDGVRAERLLDEAKQHLWDDQLDAADRYCEEAEAEMVSGCEDITRVTEGAPV